MRVIAIGLYASFALLSDGCVKQPYKHGMPAQPKPYPVLTLSIEKDLALATMVRVVLRELPANSTACLSFQVLKYGYRFLYDADSTLVNASGGLVKAVTGTNCPPSYGYGGFHVIMPNEPKRPEGYVDPYYVTIEDVHYLGANQAKAQVTARLQAYRMIRYCYARRMSRHNWRASCPAGVNEILGATPVPTGPRVPVTGYREPRIGLVYAR